MKFKSTALAGILLATQLTVSTAAHAQGSASVGGGNFTEANMKDFLGELSKYFADSQSAKVFPEITAWEQSKGIRFSNFIQTIEPKVVDTKVYGPFGEERDCVSKISADVRYFECNRARIPEAKLENQPLLYVILLHEVLVQAGIEAPTAEVVPSKYPISARMGNTQNLSLVTYQKWVPGKLKTAYDPVQDINKVLLESQSLLGFKNQSGDWERPLVYQVVEAYNSTPLKRIYQVSYSITNRCSHNWANIGVENKTDLELKKIRLECSKISESQWFHMQIQDGPNPCLETLNINLIEMSTCR